MAKEKPVRDKEYLKRFKQKRTSQQKKYDLNLITELFLKGYSYYAISQEIGKQRDYTLSAMQIWHDMKAEIDRWTSTRNELIEEHKTVELQRINRLEREAWDAWDESKNPQIKRSTKWYDKGKQGLGNEVPKKIIEKQKEKISKTGDKNYMDVIKWCIEMRCKILGIKAPKESISKNIHLHINSTSKQAQKAKENIIDAETID